MKSIKKLIAAVLAVTVIASVAVFTSSAASTDKEKTAADVGITVHYYCETGVPSIYYWNSLPTNIETTYPGVAMTRDTATGNGWYKYSFADKTKINMLFVVNGVQSSELTRNTGEWWYKNNRWYSKNPSEVGNVDRTDMREDSIYFVITTRFYDGDKGNNVHCWDDKQANNPDSDPAWRGDFKGLIQKLDYIKALGFTAIWITPVVENASGYDYHGYHAFDFSKVDPRYESDGATLQDLIDAAHEKGMKIVQDVVWNHTGNFGEKFLGEMFTKDYSKLGSVDCMQVVKGSEFDKSYPNYSSLAPGRQYDARLAILKNTDGKNHDTKDYFHHSGSLSWNGYDIQTGQIAGDCVDINTENPEVANYLTNSFMQYVDMGVDAFRLDTEKHISRWTLNSAYFPKFMSVNNFFIFGEVCARYWGVWNEGVQAISCPFYGWSEDASWKSKWSSTSTSSNLNNAEAHFAAYRDGGSAPTSSNATLNGMNYHKPDYSRSNGTGVIDFQMHWAFKEASRAYNEAKSSDKYYNDSTWNVMYVDSHDYAPDGNPEGVRYNMGTEAWAENMNLMFTFRGIPCVFYGSEIEFQKGMVIDVGPNAPLSTTGRAYFGDNIEGTITATDFGKYTASGAAQTTLNKPLAKHVRQLNLIRQAVPALQKGQYAAVGGGMSFVRRYTANGIDSLACVAISGGASFSGIPNGRYVDAVTGDVQNVSNGTLNVGNIGRGNMRVYVCCASGFKGISGKIGETGTYLK